MESYCPLPCVFWRNYMLTFVQEFLTQEPKKAPWDPANSQNECCRGRLGSSFAFILLSAWLITLLWSKEPTLPCYWSSGDTHSCRNPVPCGPLESPLKHPIISKGPHNPPLTLPEVTLLLRGSHPQWVTPIVAVGSGLPVSLLDCLLHSSPPCDSSPKVVSLQPGCSMRYNHTNPENGKWHVDLSQGLITCGGLFTQHVLASTEDATKACQVTAPVNVMLAGGGWDATVVRANLLYLRSVLDLNSQQLHICPSIIKQVRNIIHFCSKKVCRTKKIIKEEIKIINAPKAGRNYYWYFVLASQYFSKNTYV